MVYKVLCYLDRKGDKVGFQKYYIISAAILKMEIKNRVTWPNMPTLSIEWGEGRGSAWPKYFFLSFQQNYGIFFFVTDLNPKSFSFCCFGQPPFENTRRCFTKVGCRLIIFDQENINRLVVLMQKYLCPLVILFAFLKKE